MGAGRKGVPHVVVRKVMAWLVVAFLVFYLLSQPVQAAKAVRGAGHGLSHAATQLAQFFTHLT